MTWDPLADRTGQPGNVNGIVVGPLAALNARTYASGASGFATDGRKDGEGAGLGTGIPCWYDATAGNWRTYSTGAAAAA